MTAAPRLLFVVNTSWFFISHRLALAIAARQQGYEVHVATQVYSEAQREKITLAGIILHDMIIPRSSSGLLSNLALLCKFVGLYRRVRPDIVHHVTMKPNVLGGWAARLTRVPCAVYAISGLGYAFTAAGPLATLRRLILEHVMRSSLGHRNSYAIFQNPDDKQALMHARAVVPERALLIRGAGVDLTDYPLIDEPQGAVRVLMAARLLREKGVAEFVAAARVIRGMGMEAEFLLAGDIDEENPSSFALTEVRSWHEVGDVDWLGHVAAMPSLLASVHIVTLPSYYGEGVPKVLIEGAASGRAIVTTDMPGCREIVHHEGNGLLVPPHDVAALVRALKRLIENPIERSKFGMAGRERVAAEFTLQHVIDDTLQAYQALLDGARRS